MNAEQRLRYSRQIMLPEVGIGGQERLLRAKVLIVGLGGLGSPVAMYLAAAGVGHLVLVDFDRVDLSNLQRQIVHAQARLGQPKVASARERLQALNPDPRIECIEQRLEATDLQRRVAQVDIAIDGSDNFATRFAVNAACSAAGVPLVSGAAIGMEGQLTAFPGTPGGPCYQCLYPAAGTSDETCSATGILAPVAGIVGCAQATEAIKILIGAGTPLFGRLLLLDAARMHWRSLRLVPDPHCPICASPTAVDRSPGASVAQ